MRLSVVLLDDKPGTSAKAQSLALTNGVEPESLVLANLLARLQFYDIARLLAQVATDVVVVVDFAQEADTLRVLAMGWWMGKRAFFSCQSYI